MKKIVLVLLIITTIASTYSCKEIEEKEKIEAFYNVTATAPAYNEADGSLNIMGYFVDPQFSGTITSDGEINLKLPENFDVISKQAFETYNKDADSGYELSGIGIEDLLTSTENLEFSDEKPKLALAGKYYGFEIYSDSIKVGRVFPSSSKEFMMHAMNAENNAVTTGYYYMIIHSSGTFNINGRNSSPIAVDSNGDFSLFSNTTYDITLTKGWNVVKYEIKEIVVDDSEVMHAGESAFSSAKTEDLEFKWVYVSL